MDKPAADAAGNGELLPAVEASPNAIGLANVGIEDYKQRLEQRKLLFRWLGRAAGIFFLFASVWPAAIFFHYSDSELTSKHITLCGLLFAGNAAIALSLSLAVARLAEAPERKEADLKSITSPAYELVKAVVTAVRDVLKKD
jgi:hypothetical protein